MQNFAFSTFQPTFLRTHSFMESLAITERGKWCASWHHQETAAGGTGAAGGSLKNAYQFRGINNTRPAVAIAIVR